MAYRSLTSALSPQDRLISAYDLAYFSENRATFADVRHETGMVKLGPAAKTAIEGYASVADKVVENCKLYDFPWMDDGKYHDIGNTVQMATHNLARRTWPPRIITIHIRKVEDIIAVLEEAKTSPETIIAGVAWLSDQGQEDFDTIYDQKYYFLVRAARMSDAANFVGVKAGIICPPFGFEILNTHDKRFNNLVRIAVGVRPQGWPARDHQETITPKEAIKAGADYLVMGDPIWGAKDPALAARAIVQEIKEALLA
jgi:orotidine-5'-phosphate decarboxylase